MKKFFLLFIILLCMPRFTTLRADVSENMPECYLAKESKKAVSPNSLCNKGDEPFIACLAKFNRNNSFTKSRVKVSQNTSEIYREDGSLLNATSIAFKYTDGYANFCFPIKSYFKSRFYFATFYNVSQNMVCFIKNDGNYGAAAFQFERIDGLWFVTDIMLAG